MRNVNHNVLTSSTIYNGDVDRVRESLEPYMQPQELNKFLDIVYKFRNDAPRGQSILAMVCPFDRNHCLQIIFILKLGI